MNGAITLIRTDSSDIDFIQLVKLLDADLAIRDGTDHIFYSQFNKIDSIKHVIIARQDNEAVGCGAIKMFDAQTAEVKRMYCLPEKRGKGIASAVLSALEVWAEELSYSACILETGFKQPEALSLYKKSGYFLIENYGQYQGVANSVCFKKILVDKS